MLSYVVRVSSFDHSDLERGQFALYLLSLSLLCNFSWTLKYYTAHLGSIG
jgi:hypothetical protein